MGETLKTMRKRSVVILAAVFPIACFAAEMAPPGAEGTLTLKISAEGAGKHNARPGAGWTREEWQMKNSGQFTVRMRANAATADSARVEEQASAASGAVGGVVSEKDQEVLDKWQEKEDACNGNEACENKVMAQKMADPQFQRIVQKMQGGAPAILGAAKAVDMTPTVQIWSTQSNPKAAGGSMRIDLQRSVYGIVDSAGGGSIDESCRYRGAVTIKPGSAESQVSVTLRIDARASKYEMRLPADVFLGRVQGSCTNNKGGKDEPMKEVRLIGELPPKDMQDFKEALTVRGPVASARNPKLEGTHTITTRQGYGGAPVKVVIQWQFSAGAK